MKLTDLDYLGAAARSAAVVRQCVLPEYSLAETLAIARKAALHFQQTRQTEDLERLYDEEETLPLIAAARTLFSVGQSLQKQTSLERYGKPDEILLTSAVAFAMYGNFPSAHAALELVSRQYLQAQDARIIAAAICDPRRVGWFLREQGPAGVLRKFLSTWERFLRSGEEALAEILMRLLEPFLANAEVSEAALLRNARVAMRQAITLSVARCLNSRDSAVPGAFVEGLLNDNILTLLPPQYQLLVKGRVASRTSNALLNLPTSTGKTLLAECCMAAAIRSGPGLAVIVVPYIAIGNQILAALKRHLDGTDINLTGMFGGFKSGAAIDPLRRKEIVVATPERFDAWLRANGVHDLLKIVIFDEAHSISNSTRGAKLEGLITRLRLQQLRGASFRLIAMSAVLPESQALIDFLGVDQLDYFRESWRPTARHLAIWEQGGELRWLFGNDSLRPKQLTPFHTLGSRMLTWPNPLQAPPSWMPAEAQPKREEVFASQDNIAYLAKHLATSIGGPVLVVCMTRESTRLVSAAIAKKLTENPEKSLRRSTLAERAKNLAPWYTTLPSMIMKGVAFHNASLPTQLRRHIEEALCQRDLDFIVSTTTLAEGADLPFRVTILESWIVGFGTDAKPLDALMFRNIAGRCGRAGMFTEGDTVLYENLLGPSQLTGDHIRRRAMLSVISTPPALQTALPLGDARESKYDEEGRFAAISAQVIASIPENPEDEKLAAHLADASFAIRVRESGSVRALFE